MILRAVGALALTWGCASSRSVAPSLELPEATESIEGEAPWTVLMAATASPDPGIRGRALDALIRHAPDAQSTTFVTVALFDPEPWVTGHCVKGIAERMPQVNQTQDWIQALESNRSDPMLLGRMLEAAPPDDPEQQVWVQSVLAEHPSGGGRAPLSRAAYRAGVPGAEELYCADVASGDLPMDTDWLLQTAADASPCMDEAIASASVGAEPEVADALEVVLAQRGVQPLHKVLREHLTGSTGQQLERLDVWIASGALREAAPRSVTSTDPTIATAIRIAVADGRAMRAALRDALEWTDPDLIELSVSLARRAAADESAGFLKAAEAVLSRAAASPRSATRVAAVRSLATIQSDHPRVLEATVDSSQPVRLEAAIALWHAESSTPALAESTNP